MRIKIENTGRYRAADNREEEGIEKHIKEFPDCDGSMIRDEKGQTVATARQYLWCVDCEERVYLR